MDGAPQVANMSQSAGSAKMCGGNPSMSSVTSLDSSWSDVLDDSAEGEACELSS